MSDVTIHVQYNPKTSCFQWRQSGLSFEELGASEFGPVGTGELNTYHFARPSAASPDVQYSFLVGAVAVSGSLSADPSSGPAVKMNEDAPGVSVTFSHQVSPSTTVTYVGSFKIAKNGGGDDPPESPSSSSRMPGSLVSDHSG